MAGQQTQAEAEILQECHGQHPGLLTITQGATIG